MTRIIIVGSGAAGLLAALSAVGRGVHPVLLTKDGLGTGNTEWAQGGISALTSQGQAAGDTVASHVADTLAAGNGHGSVQAVQTLCAAAPEIIDQLEQHGVAFDRSGDGAYQLGLEAAHSAHRILHINGDATGQGLTRALVAACRRAEQAGNLSVIEHALVTALERRQDSGHAVRYLRHGSEHTLAGDRVLLATGGIGGLYRHTTNPVGATGDGIALAARAGAIISDMEFVQFHPTMVDTEAHPGAGMISEAVRGEGAVLVTGTGERFMPGIDPRAELAPRDVIARAIHAQNMAGHPVYLDARAVEQNQGRGFLSRRFPSITRRLQACGLNLAHDLIPVRPAQHYLMGGTLTDLYGRTTVPGLYAAGECANTAVHGANRLASNSLLEALVFARRAVNAMLTDPPLARAETAALAVHRLPETEPGQGMGLGQLQQLANDQLAVHRDGPGLREAITRLRQAQPVAASPRARHELENLLLIARLTAHAAQERTHSLGAHYRTDHPEPHPAARTCWQLPLSEQTTTNTFEEIYA
ncbi:L-aspartate oxidase [Glutamicibacter creatinolyticus]|uniref:L-aspartate oxidase n=2 Tax=Glutamicibacter creatinolyticus TaxID=162496 RepID=UPI0037BF795C